MSEEHMKRAAEWFLTLKETPLKQAHIFINNLKEEQTSNQQTEKAEEPIGPALYDTGLTADEGLWSRSGWAGRN